MKKIDFSKFKPEIEFKKSYCGSKFNIDIEKFYTGISAHGKSTAFIECPCCNHINNVFIWSFYGCGKRCELCNVLLSRLGTSIKVDEIDHNFINISKDKFLRKM